jgi:hypothetical protein
MFGGKKAPEIAAQDDRDEQYVQTYEYRTLAVLGAQAFDKELNAHAAKGWELVNGCMAGTAHYGYLRRRLQTAS